MIEIAWNALAEKPYGTVPAAVTIGVFDGLHRGHQKLIGSVTGVNNLMPVVVTFDHHPAEVLSSGIFPGYIMSRRQKFRTLRDLGVRTVVTIDFSPEFSKITCEAFLNRLLSSFDIQHAGIGFDFRCGSGVAMDGAAVRTYLERAGVPVELVSAVQADGSAISSTRIRAYVRNGQLVEAHGLLGRPFSLDIAGEEKLPSGDGFLIQLDQDGLVPGSRQLVPAPGSYRVAIIGDGPEINSTLTVDEDSIRLPLAPDDRIRYIVLQDNRI